MGAPSLFGANQILRAYFSKAIEPPPSFWLALINEVPPNPYISGEELDEPLLDSGYGRAEVPNDLATFGDQDQGQFHVVFNLIDINFNQAVTAWGSINYWALCDAEVGGNVIFFGKFSELDTVVEIKAGDQVQIPAQTLSIEFGPFFYDETT